jgi:hypothetical protein
MSEELEVLQIVHQRLTRANIPYMITGSMAMNFYAKPGTTRDIDLVIEFSDSVLDRLIQVFQDNFYIDRDMIQQELTLQTMFNVIHMPTVLKIVCIIRKDSPIGVRNFPGVKLLRLSAIPCILFLPKS